MAFVLPEFSRLQDAQAAAGGIVNAWLNVGSDDSITLTIGSAEMGQGSFSGLAQVLAEDLMVDYARVRTVQGMPSLVNPVPVGSAINTVGSSVMRNNFWKMRDAGAQARETLVAAAMNQLCDPARGNFLVANGVVTHTPTSTALTYGALAAAAALLAPPRVHPWFPMRNSG